MNYKPEREIAYSKLKSIEGSKIILNEDKCYLDIMEWASEYLEEIIKLFPIEKWEPIWSYYLLGGNIIVPKKYQGMIYKSVSKNSYFSRLLFINIEVPEKYKELLRNSAKIL